MTSIPSNAQKSNQNGATDAVYVVGRDQIRLGLPSKGRMAADSLNLLKDCQVCIRRNPKAYLVICLVFLQLLGLLLSGDLDLGIVGLDIVGEFGQGNEDLTIVHEALNFGDCHLSLAIPNYGILSGEREKKRERRSKKKKEEARRKKKTTSF